MNQINVFMSIWTLQTVIQKQEHEFGKIFVVIAYLKLLIVNSLLFLIYDS